MIPVHIHPRRGLFSVALGHAEEFPAAALVEAGVIGQQIERVDAFFVHIPADEPQKCARDAAAAEVRFGIDGADIRLSLIHISEPTRRS